MTEAVSFFISELIRAANEISKMTPAEAARLLQRAAASIREYRQQITSSYSPTNDAGQVDIVFELTVMAASIQLFPPEKVSEMFLEAAEEIKACKVLIGERRKTS
ncbi:hypothetical protein [Aminobacter ciceronei]|uniref:Uncharacterized protein n=1 Tax=Aminobacter ciceronei TaxID=150723 RepID=A0ABR6CJ21_9HYPH|nr:hypothetical protein [Aminobacter ciceronei]MBA8910840.1 hypothetical protein [Aminobacter ciceronei]MBA9024613.1 hypothetical protein [Aminobacter ciceronei]